MIHTIEPPPYAYDALEPYIDTRTMELHVDKHHQGYADKLNTLIDQNPNLQDLTLQQLLTDPNVPQNVKNMAGGVANHNFFWTILSPEFDQPVPEPLLSRLNETFGSFAAFKEQFTTTATLLFGSGWTWLVLRPDGALDLVTTANQDSPLSQELVPLLALDVWEHAYYLKYQNRRPEYIEGFWHLINWLEVDNNLKI